MCDAFADAAHRAQAAQAARTDDEHVGLAFLRGTHERVDGRSGVKGRLRDGRTGGIDVAGRRSFFSKPRPAPVAMTG